MAKDGDDRKVDAMLTRLVPTYREGEEQKSKARETIQNMARGNGNKAAKASGKK